MSILDQLMLIFIIHIFVIIVYHCVSHIREHVFPTFTHVYDIIQYFRHIRQICNIQNKINIDFPYDILSHQQISHFNYFEHIFVILSIFLNCWYIKWHIIIFIICLWILFICSKHVDNYLFFKLWFSLFLAVFGVFLRNLIT